MEQKFYLWIRQWIWIDWFLNDTSFYKKKVSNRKPNFYTYPKKNTLNSCYTLNNIEDQKQKWTIIKVIKSYIQCTLSNIVNIVPINLQVQLGQFGNLIQGKPNCSTDTLVAVLSAFGKNKSQKMLLLDVVKLAKFFLVIRLKMPPEFSAMSNRNRLGVKNKLN